MRTSSAIVNSPDSRPSPGVMNDCDGKAMIARTHGLLFSALVVGITVSGCAGGNHLVSFADLISQADNYNGRTVTLNAYYFTGFEISAISGSVGPAPYDSGRIVPTGTLIWATGGIPEGIYNKLYVQTDTPSGYDEHVGELKITGVFETGGKYGHLDAYSYRIAITNAELLEWSPPPAR